jgi:hypothetical protein
MKCEFSLEEFIQHCKRVIMKTIPLNEKNEEAISQPQEERKHWKALGLYYAIISDTAANFVESYSPVYSANEFIELSRLIKESTKDAAVKTLQTLLQTLKKRKHRHNQQAKSHTPPT